MTTVVITGSAGGMGTALRTVLEAGGTEVIGVDLHDAEVVADLATDEGLAEMVARVTERSGGAIDGLVAGAGVQSADAARILRTNYVGAVATLDSLRPLLARGTAPSAIAISSNSTTSQPGYPAQVANLLLAGDEDRAVEVIGDDHIGAYPASKLALARWVRRQAVTDGWIGAGIRLNAIAPGFVDTPMTDGMWEFVGSLGDVFPIPIGRPGRAEEVATLLAFLLSPAAGFFCGSFITVDGGTEAALRAEDWPSGI